MIKLVIDTETGGLNPDYHEMLQLALVFATPNYKFDNQRLPFKIYLKPNYPKRLDPQALSVNGLTLDFLEKHGVSQEKGAELFYSWWERECNGMQIEPIGQNWPFDRSFLMKWLGFDMFNKIFFRHYIDTCSIARYHNLRNTFIGNEAEFKSFRLQNLCEKLGIKYEKGHDAFHDCVMTLEVLRALIVKPLV